MIASIARRLSSSVRPVLVLFLAITLATPACFRRGSSGGDVVSSSSSALTSAPGDETPLTDLASSVATSNLALQNLALAAVNGNTEDVAGDAALSAARTANSANKAIEQTDGRELDQKSAKKVEGAAASAHVAAAGLADAAGKGLDPDDGMGRMAALGAAVAGGHAAATNVADAAWSIASAGPVCGSVTGIKDNLDKAAMAVAGARDAAATLADGAGSLAAATTGAQHTAAFNLSNSALEAADSAENLWNSLTNASAAMGTGGESAALADVSTQIASHKTKVSQLADKTVAAAQTGPAGNAEANANAAKAGVGDAAATCATASQDAVKKLASAVAAAHTTGASMAVAAKDAIKKKDAPSRQRLAAAGDEANKAAAKLGNAAAKATESANEIAWTIPTKGKLEKAATSAHVAAAGLGEAAAKEMDTDADDQTWNLAPLGAMAASARAASNNLVDAAGTAVDGAGVSSELGQTLAMTAAAVSSANTASDQWVIVANQVGATYADPTTTAAITTAKSAADDKATRSTMAKTSADAAQKHASASGNPTGAGAAMKSAAQDDKVKAKGQADGSTGVGHVFDAGGNSESLSKTASASASVAGTSCGGARHDAVKKLASAEAAAHTAAASQAAAQKQALKKGDADSKEKLAEVAGESNKAASKLGNAAAQAMESARESGAGTAAAEQMESTAAAAHTEAAGLAEVASWTIDPDAPDLGDAKISELGAMMGSARVASSRLSQTTADSAGAAGPSESMGQLWQITAAGAISANTAADQVGDVADAVAAEQESSAVGGLGDAARDEKSSRRASAQKAAEGSQKYSDAGQTPGSAAGDLKGAAASDQKKAKATADAASVAASSNSPGSTAWAIATTASAGGSDAPSICATASQEALKKVASSMAAAHTAAAGLATASKRAEKEKSAESMSKLADAKAEAHKAASHLANAADAALEGTSGLGLDTDSKERIGQTASSAHIAAAGLASAAGRTATDDVATCNDVAVEDLGAMLAGTRAGANSLATSTAWVLTAAPPSAGAGALSQMAAVSAASANTTADGVGGTAKRSRGARRTAARPRRCRPSRTRRTTRSPRTRRPRSRPTGRRSGPSPARPPRARATTSRPRPPPTRSR